MSPSEDDWFNVPIDDFQYWNWTLQCKFDTNKLHYRYQAPGMTDWWEGYVSHGSIEYIRFYFPAWADMRVRSLPAKWSKDEVAKTRRVKVKVVATPTKNSKSKKKELSR